MIKLLFLIQFSALCILCGVMFYYKHLLKKRLTSLQEELNRLKRENKVISAGAVGVGQRIVDLEQYINDLAWRQNKQESRQSSLASYTQATKMASMGAQINDIIDSCGLSKAEAELVMVLQKKSHDTSSLAS